MSNYIVQQQYKFSFLFSAFIFILFLIKINTGFTLGFELGDVVFYFTITATFLFSLILFLFFLKKKPKKLNLFSAIVIIVSIYHLYILTLGEGVAGNNWFK